LSLHILASDRHIIAECGATHEKGRVRRSLFKNSRSSICAAFFAIAVADGHLRSLSGAFAIIVARKDDKIVI
jgi:hypothetical protein